jgi:hypothetical protein
LSRGIQYEEADRLGGALPISLNVVSALLESLEEEAEVFISVGFDAGIHVFEGVLLAASEKYILSISLC